MPTYYINGGARWLLAGDWGTTPAATSPYLYLPGTYTTSTATITDCRYYYWSNVEDRPTPAYVDLWPTPEPPRHRVPEPPPEAPAVITARDRALSLLLDHLTQEQRRQYENNRCFDVEVNGRRYRIHPGWSGNVKLINAGGRLIESLCIHFMESLPIADLMLAQKLMLETDEAEFRRIANITRYSTPL